MSPEFLDVEEVLELHSVEIAEHGGSDGIRDRGLLDPPSHSRWPVLAVSFCIGTFSRWRRPYTSPWCRTIHSLTATNETGLAAMLVFLELNGYSVEEPRHMLVDITLAVAAGSMSKAEVTQLLRECAAKSD